MVPSEYRAHLNWFQTARDRMVEVFGHCENQWHKMIVNENKQ